MLKNLSAALEQLHQDNAGENFEVGNLESEGVTEREVLVVAESVEEVEEELHSVERTAQNIETLEGAEAELEYISETTENVDPADKEALQVIEAAVENVLVRIPESLMHEPHETMRIAFENVAITGSYSVAREKVEDAKKTIGERITQFFEYLKKKIKHFWEMVTNGVYRIEHAYKKLGKVDIKEPVKIENKSVIQGLRIGTDMDGLSTIEKGGNSISSKLGFLESNFNSAMKEIIKMSDDDKFEDIVRTYLEQVAGSYSGGVEIKAGAENIVVTKAEATKTESFEIANEAAYKQLANAGFLINALSKAKGQNKNRAEEVRNAMLKITAAHGESNQKSISLQATVRKLITLHMVVVGRLTGIAMSHLKDRLQVARTVHNKAGVKKD